MHTGDLKFEKVILEQTRGYNRKLHNTITLQMANKNAKLPTKILISADIAKAAGFEKGTRFDLLQCGTVFAFEKYEAGLLQVGSDGRSFRSTPLALHLRAKTHGCTRYDAWIDDGRILFKPHVEQEQKAV